MKTNGTSIVLLIATLGLGACGGPVPVDDLETDSEAIQGGMPESGFLAVGHVVGRDQIDPTIPASCTGVLINSRTVLTARHCIDLTIFEKFIVGTSDASGTSFPVDRWYIDPNSDQMLILLRTEITNVKPMALNPIPVPAVGSICTAVGWGDPFLGTKRSATVRVAGSAGSGPDDTFKTTGITGSADHGDSGGPLVCNGMVSGIVSSGYPGTGVVFYSPVDLQWVANMMAGNPDFRCTMDSNQYCCVNTPGDAGRCTDRNIRFAVGGAGLRGRLNFLGQTTALAGCPSDIRQKFDFFSNVVFGSGWYQVRGRNVSLCMAPTPLPESRDVAMIDCASCVMNPNRCLWRFTGQPNSSFRLQHKVTKKCLYSDNGDAFVTGGPMHQESCPSDSASSTYQREILFMDDFGSPCPG